MLPWRPNDVPTAKTSQSQALRELGEKTKLIELSKIHESYNLKMEYRALGRCLGIF